jgi:hypothetical protein
MKSDGKLWAISAAHRFWSDYFRHGGLRRFAAVLVFQ